MLARHGTTLRTELIAGLTTFLTMVYIVFVNPEILGQAGMDKGAVFTATCIAAAASTLVMGLYANYPVALAPGMGLNAFFAFTVVLTQHYTWQQALAGVFCSGAIFLLISVLPVREAIVNAIPKSLKLAISAGIGLFLGIIALSETKIVVAAPATLVTLGDLAAGPAALCLLGFILIAALNARRVVGATLIGMLTVTVLGIPLGLATFTGIVAHEGGADCRQFCSSAHRPRRAISKAPRESPPAAAPASPRSRSPRSFSWRCSSPRSPA
jgi:AGZA family xanthine/uracil permease-like MFS transporter